MFLGLDLTAMLQSIGIIGITIIIFLESGIPFGFIFPGDSLLFTAGVLAAAGYMNLPLLVTCVFVAAILGVNAGYAFGKRYGRKMFNKEDSIVFSKNHITRAEEFYKEHGGKAIILARFIPVIRTFAPIVAGIGLMDYRRFMFFNVVGAVIWAIGVTVLGYILGNTIPAEVMEKYLILIVLVMIIVSFIPAVIHMMLDKRKKSANSNNTEK